MISLGLFQNEEGYIMTFKETYIEIVDTIHDYFNDLGADYWSVYTEATLMADGIIRQIELFGNYSYHGKRWKRFA